MLFIYKNWDWFRDWDRKLSSEIDFVFLLLIGAMLYPQFWFNFELQKLQWLLRQNIWFQTNFRQFRLTFYCKCARLKVNFLGYLRNFKINHFSKFFRMFWFHSYQGWQKITAELRSSIAIYWVIKYYILQKRKKVIFKKK